MVPGRYHCEIHPDLNMADDVRSHWSSFGFTSKASLKSHSQILAAALPWLPHCLLSSSVLRVMPMHGFCQKSYSLLAQSAGRKENIKARNSDAGNRATCITSGQKLAVVLAILLIDLFRVLQTVSFWLLRFLFIHELLKTKQTTTTMEALDLGNMVKNDQVNIEIFFITWQL